MVTSQIRRFVPGRDADSDRYRHWRRAGEAASRSTGWSPRTSRCWVRASSSVTRRGSRCGAFSSTSPSARRFRAREQNPPRRSSASPLGPPCPRTASGPPATHDPRTAQKVAARPGQGRGRAGERARRSGRRGPAVVISHTTAGRDFALEWALERLRPSLRGTLRVGSVGPSGLLAGATLRDVELGDGRGRAVLVADSIRARYSIAELFGGPPAIADLRIWSPRRSPSSPNPGSRSPSPGSWPGRRRGRMRGSTPRIPRRTRPVLPCSAYVAPGSTAAP